MIELKELDDYLKQLLQPEEFNDYCPNGIQIEGKKDLLKVGFAVSANLDTIQKAVDKKVDALICHHGLFWTKDSYRIVGSKKEKISLLLKNEISLFGYHLPLDAHQSIGNNYLAAQELGWENLQPFGMMGNTAIGVEGLIHPTPIDEVVRILEEYYQHTAHVSLGGPRKVNRLALISGGAWRSIEEAVEKNVDVFITGNFDEPAYSIAQEEKIHFIALGHSATERVGPYAVCQRVKEDLPIQAEFIESLNPF